MNIVEGRNFYDPTPDQDWWLDMREHGTSVAGIIGAKNSGRKVWGVMPGVRLFVGKVRVGWNGGWF